MEELSRTRRELEKVGSSLSFSFSPPPPYSWDFPLAFSDSSSPLISGRKICFPYFSDLLPPPNQEAAEARSRLEALKERNSMLKKLGLKVHCLLS